MIKSLATSLPLSAEREESGFTLIELLVVVLIIGILSSISVPVFLNQRKAANESAVKSDMINAAKIFETELISNKGKSYPTVLPAGLKTSSGVTLSLPTQTAASAIVDVPARNSVSGYSVNVRFMESATGLSHYRHVQGMDKIHLFEWKASWACSNGSDTQAMTEASFAYIYNNGTAEIWNQPLSCNAGYTRVPGSIIVSTPPKSAYAEDLYAIGSTQIPDTNKKIALKASAQGFCLNGTHENIGGKTFKYDSLNGGFSEGSC